jgi:hypothetical protein
VDRHDDGGGAGSVLGSKNSRFAVYYEDIDFETDKLRWQFRDLFKLPGRISLLDDDVLTLKIPELLQPLPKRSEPVLVGFGRRC